MTDEIPVRPSRLSCMKTRLNVVGTRHLFFFFHHRRHDDQKQHLVPNSRPILKTWARFEISVILHLKSWLNWKIVSKKASFGLISSSLLLFLMYLTGTLSNKTAGFRACRCLEGFYRLDRFGPCSECPAHGIDCVNDTAILAPNYYWKWTNQSHSNFYENFVQNIHSYRPDYNHVYSRFTIPLPKPVKCPYAGSCKGGIYSECNEGYRGDLCATCRNGYYLRFNTCLKCPRFAVAIVSSVVVVALFVIVFLMVFWGESKQTDNNRTVADVIMSCFKIVIGFYQVISGIFTALARVKWPVTLIPMEKFLKVVEGNIFQFAPLSCIYYQLRLDAFSKFVLVLSINFSVVCTILCYIILKKIYIIKKNDCPDSQKLRAVSRLKKSCYRNIFLFLLASYPMTSKTIIRIIPLPGACVTHCFTDNRNHCTSLLKADYSLQCFTARHKMYWPVATMFSLYPIGFPLLALLFICKCRKSQFQEEITFGMKVFYENYKDKFWYWEITEMYRKLTLISFIFLFGSDGVIQIGLTLLVVSVFGVAYTLFRPIKGKFEDRLQTFVLWVIFFDVCLGAMTLYSGCDGTKDEGSDSIIINILFVVLNSSILLIALGKSFFQYYNIQSFWNYKRTFPQFTYSTLQYFKICSKNSDS